MIRKILNLNPKNVLENAPEKSAAGRKS